MEMSDFSIKRDGEEIFLTSQESMDAFVYQLDRIGNAALEEACERNKAAISPLTFAAIAMEISNRLNDLVFEKAQQVAEELVLS